MNTELNKIYNIDLRKGKELIQEDSIDWIITDPPYSKEYIPLCEDLSDFANYSLKETGGLLVMMGQSYLPKVLTLLSKKMTYVWTLAYLTPGGQSPYLFQRKCNSFWKPILLFSKAKYLGKSFGDVIKTSPNNNDKKHHKWGQSVEGFDDLIKRFTNPKDIIIDPFLGAGTTAVACKNNGRNYIGFDISSDYCKIAEDRLKESIKQVSL